MDHSTGIKQRRKAAPGEYTSLFAVRAARQAVERAGLTPDDIDLILCATVSPDQILPSTGCIIQAELGNRAAAMDVVAACSGFLYGVTLANTMIQAGQSKNALVIGAEILTQYVDYSDRHTCVLFEDGLVPRCLGQLTANEAFWPVASDRTAGTWNNCFRQVEARVVRQRPKLSQQRSLFR